ncbi:MAG TPA: ABC transporter permease [Chryseosolibacter sp.]|nr:ABC transporter permease [Chryseosolibacter sp.]
MIRYNLLLFIRNLSRQKLFSTINLLGLTVSLVSTILIYLYVRHELSFDSFHHHTDRLYRVNQTFIWAESSDTQFSRTGPGVAHALKEELPEVELVSSLHTPGSFIVSYEAPSGQIISFEENDVFAADTNFFKVFNFPLLKGDPDRAFRLANTLVMTQSTAQKYFEDGNAVGKIVRLSGLNGDEVQTYEVTGVVEDPPDNSTIQFDVLLSMEGFPVRRFYWSWVWTQLEAFVLLRENTRIDQVREKLKLIPRKRADETIRAAMGMTYDEYIKSGKKWDLFLQPIKSIHLPENPVNGSFPDTGNIKIIYSFIGAALFIVILSCINFMNLSTAQFTKRLKEVSVRKVMGIGKMQLGISYFIEALVFCMIALAVAIAVTQLILPFFNMTTGKSLQMDLLDDPALVVILLGLIVLMSAFSSSYPAMFLTRFHPVEALKGKVKAGRQGMWFRNGLVVFQFSVSIILIICTSIVFQQLTYVSEKDLGFDKENLLVIRHVEGLKNPESLRDEALTLPGVVSASWCSSTPPEVYNGDTYSAEGLSGRGFSLNYTSTDENYIPTLGIELIFGRNFSASNPGDKDRVIINAATVRKIGWPLDETVLGTKITYPNNNDASFEVIGVVSDFNYWTLATSIEPMAMFHLKNENVFHENRRFVVLKVEPQDLRGWETTLAATQELWNKHAGGTPFDYRFVDDNFADTFKTQQQFGKVLTALASLAILIASLGLLGMIVYALEQRSKEIGIRKVSGASVWDILKLISRGYTALIMLAFLIGAPFAYWMMNVWLDDFAYRITPSVWIFAFAGLGTLFIALLITSYHSLKAAMTNPVDVLRDE